MRRSSFPFSMDRPLPTFLLFTWAIVFSHSPLLADSRLHDIRLNYHKHKVHNHSRSHFHPQSHTHYSSAPSSSNLSPPPSPKPVEHEKNHPPPPHTHRNKSRDSPHNHHHFPIDHRRSTKRKVNIGKKFGLLFVGIAVFLQLAFGLFLGLKRWQISKMERRAS